MNMLKACTYGKCPICKKSGWIETHRRAPRWEVVSKDAESYADEGDCWRTIYAQTAEGAAEEFADDFDSYQGEFTEERDVLVRDREGNKTTFCVRGELVLMYRAEEV